MAAKAIKRFKPCPHCRETTVVEIGDCRRNRRL